MLPTWLNHKHHRIDHAQATREFYWYKERETETNTMEMKYDLDLGGGGLYSDIGFASFPHSVAIMGSSLMGVREGFTLFKAHRSRYISCSSKSHSAVLSVFKLKRNWFGGT